MTSAECTSQTWHSHLSNQLLPAAATCVSPTHPWSLIRPKGVTLHPSPAPLSLLLCLCLLLAALTWKTRCTARYDPDVTTNPKSTYNTANLKTSPGQMQTKTHTHTHTHKYSNNTPPQSVSADSADPGGKRSYVVWAFLSPTSPTASDNKRKRELPVLTYRRATP